MKARNAGSDRTMTAIRNMASPRVSCRFAGLDWAKTDRTTARPD
jgi:hypothetical protein